MTEWTRVSVDPDLLERVAEVADLDPDAEQGWSKYFEVLRCIQALTDGLDDT